MSGGQHKDEFRVSSKSMSEGNPQVIVIAGPNGAGKTTLAPFLLRDSLRLLEYVNADPIALGLSGFDPASVALGAGRVMLNRLHELAEQRRTFAFESTLAARSYAGWIERLRSDGYNFQLIFLWLQSAELAVHRVRERVRFGGHDVAEQVVRRRYAAGLKNFWALYQPLADAWSVYDNSISLEPVSIAAGGRDRPLTILERDSWTRFSKTKP
jgi:predicted ABC-type ATPase